jgi:DNA-binding NarL/FixJ family response regulator
VDNPAPLRKDEAMTRPATVPSGRGIFLVDDHPCVLDGVRLVIERKTPHRILGTATTGNAALTGILQARPDLVILDLVLPDRSGLELIKDVKAQLPDVRFLALSMNDEQVYAERVLRAGGHGYIMKGAASDVLIEAIGRVLSDGNYLSSKATSHLLGRITGARSVRPRCRLESLSDRQMEVFKLVGEGKDNREIAAQLHLSPRTVEAHKVAARKRLGLPDAAALLLHAITWTATGKLPD